LIEKGKTVTSDQVNAGKASCQELRTHLHEQMTKNGIDLWLTPAATGPAPAGIHATGNPAMNMPWTHAGLPTLTLPAGKAATGLPLGLQFSGKFGMDEELLAWADGLNNKL
jgi:Asp-tRNA(Asn)/Glu-tRNA(Gln) amidotransferase A subunit family amidase